jgi:hypothetical protein
MPRLLWIFLYANKVFYCNTARGATQKLCSCRDCSTNGYHQNRESITVERVVKTEIEKTPIEGVLVTFINECDGSKQQVVTGPTGYMLLIWKKVVIIPSKYQRTVMELLSIKLIK